MADPKSPFLVDRHAVRLPLLGREFEEEPPVGKPARLSVEIVTIDPAPDRVGEIEDLSVRRECRPVGTGKALVRHDHGAFAVDAVELADRLALLDVGTAKPDMAEPIDLAVIEGRILGPIVRIEPKPQGPRREIDRIEAAPAGEEEVFRTPQQTAQWDLERQIPTLVRSRRRVERMDRGRLEVEPIKTPLLFQP